MIKTMMFWTVKGGAGKTTSLLTVSKELAKRNKKVLVIDLDPQANTSKSLLGEKIYTKDYISMSDLFVPNPLITVEEAIMKTEDKNIDIIGSSLDLVNSEMKVRSDPMCDSGRILKKIINKIKHDYNTILLDFNPYPSLLTTNGLVASDFVFVPTTCDEWALDGVINTIIQIDQVQKNFEHDIKYKILFNMINRNKTDGTQKENIMEQLQKNQYFKTYINFQAKPFTDKEVSAIDFKKGNTTVGKQWKEVINELMEDLNNG